MGKISEALYMATLTGESFWEGATMGGPHDGEGR